MLHCLKCEANIPGNGWDCPNCGYSPEVHNGFPCFAPDIDGVDAFDVASIADLGESLERSFWFPRRNRLIAWALRKYAPSTETFLEIGCGTGFVLKILAQDNPELKLTGAEIYVEGLSMASQRLKGGADFIQLNALHLPFRDHFDAIGAFDVIEHIDDDVAALKEIYRAVKPGGSVIIIVPRHMFLWSSVDETARHKRRYSGAELREKMLQAGFESVRQLSFGALTMPFQFISRRLLMPKGGKHSEVLEIEVPGVVGYILGKLLDLDQMLIRMGVNYPFGASLMAIARKKSVSDH